ncbi:hypothetical protein [Streptomyces sp. NPDC004267]|uniref:hypothetical protein n=1 Tax=Streptomyces sp. NPDC004267 TaxID=3364694 RepID=UPI0036BA0DF3
MASALDVPQTAGALDRYRTRARGWAAVGLGSAAAGGFLFAESADGMWSQDAGAGFLMFGLIVAGIGLGTLVTARRMRRALTSRPWSAHPAVVPPYGMRGPAVVLSDPATGEAWPLAVRAVQQRHHLAQPGASGVLWWCGDPARGGVLAQPGGGVLVWAAPVRGAGTRARLVRQAADEGLLGRPVPVQPQTLGPVRVPAQRPARRPGRRRLGAWRWVVLLGAIGIGIAVAGDRAAEHDPQIDLTVLELRPDHGCTVSWRDPFDGTRRTGAYRCTTDLPKNLDGWDSAYVVSYGPWKGELYNPLREDSDAAETTAFAGLLGLALLPVGLVGGTVGFALRRRRRHVAVPSGALAAMHTRPRRTSAGLTYAVLAAHARSRKPNARAKRRRPGADVRDVPWWRVRGLRELSGLHPLAGGLLMLLLMAGMWWWEPGFQPVLGVVGALFLTVTGGYRFLAYGRRVAPLLARAAVAPVPVPKRYVLLGAPRGHSSLLVVFPAHGGAEDRPEGVLPVWPEDAPDSSVGEVELRGWLDRSPDGHPLVVPWVDGRPLWPTEPYLEAGTPEFAEVMAPLVPPAVTARR